MKKFICILLICLSIQVPISFSLKNYRLVFKLTHFVSVTTCSWCCIYNLSSSSIYFYYNFWLDISNNIACIYWLYCTIFGNTSTILWSCSTFLSKIFPIFSVWNLGICPMEFISKWLTKIFLRHKMWSTFIKPCRLQAFLGLFT